MTTLNIPQVKHSTLKKIYSLALKTKKSVLVVGKYGIGKTASAYEFAKEHGMKVVDVKLSQFDAVTFRGIPSVKDGKTVWNIPHMMAELQQGNTVLLLDEFDKAQPSVASASYELLLQRRYGDYLLPDTVLIVATANFESEDFRSQGFSIPQLDRCIKVELVIDSEEWLSWAKENNVDERVIEFIRNNPNLLWREGNEESMTATSPRSWVTASQLISEIENDYDLMKTLVAGCVGFDLADIFVKFVMSMSKANYGKILEEHDTEAVRKMNIGEKKQFIQYCAKKLEKEPAKIFSFITKYLSTTGDAETTVFMMRELKAEVGEEKFNNIFRLTEWTGKREFVKRLVEITKQMEARTK
jgi:hypothetical protein